MTKKHDKRDNQRNDQGRDNQSKSAQDDERLRLELDKLRLESEKLRLENGKLTHDTDKVLLENRQLKRPLFFTPSTWVAVAALIGVFIQFFFSNLSYQKADILKEKAQLDTAKALAEKSTYDQQISKQQVELASLQGKIDDLNTYLAKATHDLPPAPPVKPGEETVTISGQVSDFGAGPNVGPISGVVITSFGENAAALARTLTDGNGRYSLKFKRGGQVSLLFDKVGYLPRPYVLKVTADEDQTCNVQLFRAGPE